MKILKQVTLLMIVLFINSSLLSQTETQSTSTNEPPAWKQFQEDFGDALGEAGDAFNDLLGTNTDAKSAYDHAVESLSEAMLAGEKIPKMIKEVSEAVLSHCALPEDQQVKWKRRNTVRN